MERKDGSVAIGLLFDDLGVGGLESTLVFFPASADKGVAWGHFSSDLVLTENLGVDEVSGVQCVFCNAWCTVARDF